jgi:hypothetical protein
MRRALPLAAMLAAVLAAAPAARADSPPYETTDTEIADKLELMSFVTEAHGPHQQIVTGAFDLAIPLARRWEMTIVPSWSTVHEPGLRAEGLGDTEIAFKYLAVEESATTPATAVEPNFTLPTGDRSKGLGEGVTQVELPVLVSKHWGPVRLTGRFGYARSGADEFAPVSILAERSFMDERFRLGVEAAGDLPLRRPSDLRGEVNVGGSWKLREGLEIQAMVGRRTAGGQDEPRYHSRLVLRTEF